jgi:hypothetical protein
MPSVNGLTQKNKSQANTQKSDAVHLIRHSAALPVLPQEKPGVSPAATRLVPLLRKQTGISIISNQFKENYV